MSISENIKYLRKQKHMTQKQLAEKTGLAVITIQQYEAGKYLPKHDKLVKLAIALECKIPDIDESIVATFPDDPREILKMKQEREQKTAEAEEIIKRRDLGEVITEEEQQKISDYIEYRKEIEDLKHKSKVLVAVGETFGSNAEEILSVYRTLNENGREEARKRVCELMFVPKYSKYPPTSNNTPQD